MARVGIAPARVFSCANRRSTGFLGGPQSKDVAAAKTVLGSALQSPQSSLIRVRARRRRFRFESHQGEA
jgi:hypothetical protein